MIKKTSDLFFLPLHVLRAVCRSFLANRLSSNKWIPLPPVAPSLNTSLSMDELIARVDRIVRFAVWNTAHRCLYASYARCCILRRWGYQAKLNMGLHNLQTRRNTEGHCWISLHDQSLYEEKDPHLIYPDVIGERDDTVYWARLKKDGEKAYVRLKKSHFN